MPKERLKDLDAKSKAYYETLSPDLKGFVNEFIELRGSAPIITSGRREASRNIGKNPSKSKHLTGDALDIAPNVEDYNFLVNTKEGLGLMAKYGVGILDETDPRTIQKTKATGAHFHIGKDPKLAGQMKTRYEKYDNEFTPMYSFKERYEKGDNPEEIEVDEHNHEHVHELPEEYSVPFQEKTYQDIFVRTADKEILKEVKAEQSEDRKEIKNEISREEEFLREYLKPTAPKQPANIVKKEIKETVEPRSINVDIQTQLPTLPNLFELPQFKEGGSVGYPPPIGIRDYEEYLRRIQAYSDSLSLYNRNIKLQPTRDRELEDFIKFGLMNRTISQSNIGKTVTDNKSKKINLPKNGQWLQDNLKEANQWNNINKKILPTNVGRTYKTDSKGNILKDKYGTPFVIEYPIYKKPVQPVVYEPDPEIVAKQQKLIDAGYEIGKADGVWGDKSKKAWEEYQIKIQQENKPVQVTPKVEIVQPTTTQQTTTPQEGRFAYKNQTVLDPTTNKWVIKQVPYAQYIEGKGWVTLGTPGLINK